MEAAFVVPFFSAVWACAPRARRLWFLAAIPFLLAPPSRAETISMSSLVSNSGVISGYVYYDENANGKPDLTDWALYQAEVSLTNVGTGASTDVLTAADGSYAFTGLAAGTYTIAMLTPCSSCEKANLGVLYDASGDLVAYAGFDEHGYSVVAAGIASMNKVSDVILGAGYKAEWYDFGELVYPVALISKQQFIGGGYMEHLPIGVIPPAPDWGPVTPEPSFLAMALGAAGLATVARFAGRGRRRRCLG
jgi:hypothetical protein